MKSRVGIFGTAGMAAEAADIAVALGLEPVLIAQDQAGVEASSYDLPVILEAALPEHPQLPCVVGIGSPAIRRRIVDKYASFVEFTSLIHPDASFGRGQRERTEQSEGVIVCAGVRMTCNITVGRHTIFNLNSSVSHDAVISDFAVLSPQSCILGNVVVGESAFIGANATVNQGKPGRPRLVGAEAVIGSGSVVIGDCEPGRVYAGVPARLLK